jgi:hypothetical protein
MEDRAKRQLARRISYWLSPNWSEGRLGRNRAQDTSQAAGS